MTKKIYAIAFAALAMCSFTSMAQTQTTGRPKKEAKMEQRAERRLDDARVCKFGDEAKPCCKQEALMQGIELTAEQKTKIEALNQKQAQERQKDQEKAKQEKAKKMEARNKEMKKILTPEQYAQYEANAQAMKQAKADGKGQGKGHGDKARKGGKDAKKGNATKGCKDAKGCKDGQKCKDAKGCKMNNGNGESKKPCCEKKVNTQED